MMNTLASPPTTLRRLTVIHPGTFGGTQRLVSSFCEGAATCSEIHLVSRSASVCTEHELLDSDAIVFATPEHFGYMAGSMKAMFDRLFYRCMQDSTALDGGTESLLAGRAYAVIVCAGNDGTGAAESMTRIITGWRMRKVADDLIVRRVGGQAGSARGKIADGDIARCKELGQSIAEGISMGAL
ncbi:MAG: flavodoxin family protein [Betaproteobacteria bacterium]|nr:MAG: flavodoxin family protein [Betaproteobacteria bacterium]